jgi:UDP-3-O-acyl N-acetylglucosamine deacetylase
VDCGDGTSDPLSLKQRTFGSEGPSGEVQAGALEAAGEGAVYLHGAERMNSEVALLLAEALESGEFRREGGRRTLPMKAGVILSTTADLQITPIKELFDREIGALISREPVRVPPLRERWEDIPSLCEHFLSQYCSHHGLRRPVIAEEAMEAMEKHAWPDNIKGLMNTIEWLIAQETGEVVEVEDLPGVVRGITEKEAEDRPTVQVRERRKGAKGALIERLKENNGNLRKTASELGISEGDLRAGIADDRPGASSGRTGAGVAQRTLGKSVLLSGQGLHSGLKTGLILSPLPPDSGIRFGSITTEETVPAHLDNVVSTDFATTLQRGTVKVRTIEHLMSTLHAYGVHNLLIKVENEIPIMDGSAVEFCRLIDEAGVIEQEASLDPLKIQSTVEVVSERPGQEPAVLKIEPHTEFIIEFQFLLPKPIGMQKFSYTLDGPESFRDAIAPARTFGEIKEVERQGKRGLIGGGRLDNVILLDAGRVINTELRFPDEFVRHKILDVIGDLYLLGRPLRGKVTARMSGHTENIKLLRKIQTA